MQSLVLTKAHQFQPFTGFMDEAGIPVAAYLARHGLPARMLEMPDLYVDETRFWRLADELARREGLPDFGFRVGQQMRLEDVGEFGSMLMRQASLMQALRTFCIAIREECYGVTFDLEHHGNHIWLGMNHPGKEIFSPIFELYDLQFMWRIVESALGSKWLPPGLSLKADSLPPGLREEDVCTGPIRFSARRTSFAIPAAFLATPMGEYLPQANLHSGDQFKLAASKLDFPTQLRLLLQGHLGDNINVRNLADLLYVSERSLQRRLTESGTSFRQLQEESRFELAKYLLNDDDLSITEIGFELGYTKPANFSRAFQRWAGVSPRQYRTRSLQ